MSDKKILDATDIIISRFQAISNTISSGCANKADVLEEIYQIEFGPLKELWNIAGEWFNETD